MCTKHIHSPVSSDTISTSLTSRSILSRQSAGTQSTSQSTLNLQSFKNSINSRPIVNQRSINSQLSVDRLTVMYKSTLDDMSAKLVDS